MECKVCVILIIVYKALFCFLINYMYETIQDWEVYIHE